MLSCSPSRFIDISVSDFGKEIPKCYILRNKDHCLIIDPSAESQSISQFLKNVYKPSKVDFFLTKADAEHGKAVFELSQSFENSKIFISKNQPLNNLQIDKNKIKTVSNNDNIFVDDEKMFVIESGDSISLYAPESRVVFVGDSFHQKKGLNGLLDLPKNTIVMSSHDDESSIRLECIKYE